MNPATRLAAAAWLAATLPAAAQGVDIAWSASGEFERRFTVAPGKFAELCGALDAGQAVQWRFEASQALDFNIHYHLGKDVHYPARAEQVTQSRGALAAEAAQDYCWMWTNKAATAAALQVQLKKR